jgi:Ca-activated chloride channel family protein
MRAHAALFLTFALTACSADMSYAPTQGVGPAPLPEGDRYTAVGTNPFVTTAHDPFSTFAIDVDTASYDIFRRDVERGTLPSPASVRLEEYVNSFAYDYPVPAHDAAVPLTVSLGGAPALSRAGTSIVRIALQGKAPPPMQRLPANLVFLIDTSGSMQGEDRLPLVQLVLTSALDALVEGDTVAIVTYAGSTGVALPPTPAARRSDIQAAIADFAAGGSTAGAAGLDLAYAQAERAFIPGGFNHVLLCTDGDFNVGPSSDEALLAQVRSKRDTGITLTVLGFGVGNLNDSMMEKVSNAGNGFYSVISSARQARLYGGVELMKTVEIIARDAKVQVEFNPAHVEAYRLLGYENRLIADASFRDDTVDGGELGSGHRVTALYEVVRAGGQVPTGEGVPATVGGQPVIGARTVTAEDALTVRVRYKAPMAGDADPATEVAASLSPAALALGVEGDADTRFAAAVAAWAEILKGSPYADRAQLDAIEAVATAQAGRDAGRAEFARLLALARPRLPR